MKGNLRLGHPAPGSVEDILHEFLSGASHRPGAPFNEPKKVLNNSLRLVRNTAFRASIAAEKSNIPIKANSIWAYSTTHNQSVSVVSVLEKLAGDGSHAIVHDPYSVWGRALALQVLKCVPYARKKMLELSKCQLEKVADLGELLTICLAEKACVEALILKTRPAMLLLSNDHSPRNRAIYAGALKLKLPVAYLQHAAVGGVERDLDMTLALLQGRRSLDVYKTIGPVTADVRLVGSPKIDTARREVQNHKVKSKPVIGIFPGLFDNPAHVKEIFKTLSEGPEDYLYRLRCHPRDERTAWMKVLEQYGGSYGEQSQTGISALLECDVIIFDDSNIGLEAAALGSPVLRMRLSNKESDQYGLTENPLFKECEVHIRDVTKAVKLALSGELRPNVHVLDDFYEGWSSDSPDSDTRVSEILRSYLD